MIESRIEISNFSAPELDVYARLNEAQLRHYYEPKGGIFIAESEKVITRALEAGCEPISCLLEKGQECGEAQKLLERCKQVPVYIAEHGVLRQLTGFPMTRGLLCAMRRPELPAVSEICRKARRIAILEEIVNPTNVGAIFRSAAALNLDAILLTPGCSDPLYRRASRVSMGAVFQVPWTYFGARLSETGNGAAGRTKSPVWPAGGIALLHEMGFQTVAMALQEDSIRIDDPRLLQEERLAIVLGTEGDGLAAETIAACDYTVRIPMTHGVDSLNVAAASAVAFWCLAAVH